MPNTPPSLSSAVSQNRRGAAWLTAEWFRCLLIAAIGFVVRLPALQGEPIWDDDYLVRTNPFIKSPLLALESFRHYLFQDTFSAHYRPVQNLSYRLDYLIWNNNFYGFHLTSLLCHVLAGVLLYLLLARLLPRLETRSNPDVSWGGSRLLGLVAFFIALLWVVHPVHSAAVDYVSGRADSLAFLFACSGWLLLMAAQSSVRAAARWAGFTGAWIFGLLALCSRETGIIWVIIFGFVALTFDRSLTTRLRWGSLAGCAALLGAYWLLRSLAGAPSLPEDPGDLTPPLFRIVLMFRALGDYARLMLFAYNLHMERTVYNPKAFGDNPGRWSALEHEYLSIAGLIVIGAVVFLSLRRGRGRPLRLLGAAWFVLAFLPISNLISLNATVAEHWLYLPSVGALIFLVGCALELPRKWYRHATVFACIAIFALGVRSTYRSSDWVSNETFAARTIASGGTTLRVVLLLAQGYTSRGDYPAAERLLRRAVQLSPDYPMARNNLADALLHEGKKDEAEALFVHSTQTASQDKKGYPRTWIAALNLSQVLHKQNDDSGALAVLEQARGIYPGTWELISAESELLRECQQVDRAL